MNVTLHFRNWIDLVLLQHRLEVKNCGKRNCKRHWLLRLDIAVRFLDK